MARYEELREILAGEIASGHYAVGGRFPTDFELCSRFGVSRHTVREALRDLQDQGLLERRRGAGTVVCARGGPTLFTQNINSLGELLDSASDTRFERRYEGVVVMRRALAEPLGCAPGGRWLRFAGVRWHKHTNIPLCWTEIYVTEPYFGVRAQVDDNVGTIYELVQRQFGIEIIEIQQEVSSVSLDPDQAAEINAEPKSPGLLVVRRYYTNVQELFEIAVSLYPGDRFTFKTSLRRSGRRRAATRSRAANVK